MKIMIIMTMRTIVIKIAINVLRARLKSIADDVSFWEEEINVAIDFQRRFHNYESMNTSNSARMHVTALTFVTREIRTVQRIILRYVLSHFDISLKKENANHWSERRTWGRI